MNATHPNSEPRLRIDLTLEEAARLTANIEDLKRQSQSTVTGRPVTWSEIAEMSELHDALTDFTSEYERTVAYPGLASPAN